MSAPAFVTCLCTHTQRRHVDQEGACVAAGCGCMDFRETDAPVDLEKRHDAPKTVLGTMLAKGGYASSDAEMTLPVVPPGPAQGASPRIQNPAAASLPLPPSVEPARKPTVFATMQPSAFAAPQAPGRSVLRDGLASPKVRTRQLAEKIQSLLADLKDRLLSETAEAIAKAETDRQRAQAQQEIAELEEKLRAARALLRGAPADAEREPRPRTPEAPAPCPHCPKVNRSKSGLMSHIRSAHPDVDEAES
ncbi:MAG TPA: hypothetical protein VGH54_10360 [Mycobacterium sp.]|jgi:hypothetical protein|uniref:hypothetical protein n=1 Tax=Mycobacterium sp. TaxID=1785 RepID=UPI002F40C4AA